MTLVRTRSLTLSVLMHAAVISCIIFLPTISFRKKPKARIYTVNVIREATFKKKPLPKPKVKEVKEKKKPKPKPKKKEEPKPKKKLVKKNIFDEKKTVKKKIEEREKKLEKKFVEPEEFLKKEKVTVETENDEFPYYGDLVASKVRRSWVQPSKAMVGDKPLQTVIAFRIFRDGRAAILAVKFPSGEHFMDESATKAIEDAQPFPPFPAGETRESVDVTLTFELEE